MGNRDIGNTRDIASGLRQIDVDDERPGADSRSDADLGRPILLTVTRLLVRPFEADDLPAAARLLASRHDRQLRQEPLLSSRFTAPEAAEAEVASLWQTAGSSGAIAIDRDQMVGFVLGVPKTTGDWGPNMWVEAAGHAVQGDHEMIRDLYACAAQRWVDAGRTAHYVVIPASEPAWVDAWFHLGFGLQHVHALRASASSVRGARAEEGVHVRRARREDIPALAVLDLLLPEHQGRSPVFSAGAVPSLAEAEAEWVEAVEDEAFATFTAEDAGTLVGAAVGCSVEKSSTHTGLSRPDHAAFLGFAVVSPAARGRGVGRALGEAVISWAASSGFPSVVTDWRATNLLSSRTWPRLGFRPAFLRLHRVTGY